MPVPSIYSILAVGRAPSTGVTVLNKGNSAVNAGAQLDLGPSGNATVACLVSSTQSNDGIDSVTVGGVSIPAATSLLNWTADFSTSRHRMFLATGVTLTGLQDYEISRITGDNGFDAIFVVLNDVVSVGSIVQPSGQLRDTGEVYSVTVASNADSLIVNLIQRDRKNAVGVLNASGGSTVTNHDSQTFGFSVARRNGSAGSVAAAASSIMIVRGLAFSAQGTAESDTTPPTLSSPTGAGGVAVCSGTVSTNEAGGQLYAVATASATSPTALQVRNGQDHTGAAALRVVAGQAVSSSGTQTIASGAIGGGAGTRYLHYMHEDAAGNRSAVVSSAGFSVTANATQLVLTVPDAAGLSGFSGVVLSAAAPGAGVTVLRTITSLAFNGSGQSTIDISGLGVAVGAYRWVSVTNSNGTPGQSPAPVQAQGPVIAS